MTHFESTLQTTFDSNAFAATSEGERDVTVSRHGAYIALTPWSHL